MNQDLYHPIILQRNKAPKHFAKDKTGEKIIAYNPVCGDEFEIRIKINAGMVADVSYTGYGCAVSKASIDLLLDEIINKGPREAEFELNKYLNQLESPELHDEESKQYPLAVFRVVQKYPARKNCAELGAKSLLLFFRKKGMPYDE